MQSYLIALLACLLLSVKAGTGDYILGQGGQTECPIGSTIVSTPGDCFSTELLDEISAGRGFETDSHFGVRGCFYHPNGNVFFQTTPATRTNTGYQPVCRSNAQAASNANEYTRHEGKHCDGSSISKWADGSNALYGAMSGIESCKAECDAHAECAGFVQRDSDNKCGFWKKGPLKPYPFGGHHCYEKRAPGPILYFENQICGNYQHVSASLSQNTNSPEKCATYVMSECSYKEFFTWRSTNNACHCVEEPNCDNPFANNGLNIYRIQGVTTGAVASDLIRSTDDGECSGFVDYDSGRIFENSGDFEECKRFCKEEPLCRGVTLGEANKNGYANQDPHCWFHYASWNDCISVAIGHGEPNGCYNWLGSGQSNRDNFRTYVFSKEQLETIATATWTDQCWYKSSKPAFLKECRWESNHDQTPHSNDYMGWTCADNEVLTGFGLSANEHDITKIQCCKLGGHSAVKPNTCTYVDSSHKSAECGNGNDHMVFSGAYDKSLHEVDAVTEILVGKCCEVECDSAWCSGKDWGVDKDNCQVISTSNTVAQELVCPSGTLLTEVEDGLTGNAHGVQKVASITCCALDLIAPPTFAPSPAPSTSMPSVAPTTTVDCLLALYGSQLTDAALIQGIDECLPGCLSTPHRRSLESRLLSENNRRQ